MGYKKYIGIIFLIYLFNSVYAEGIYLNQLTSNDKNLGDADSLPTFFIFKIDYANFSRIAFEEVMFLIFLSIFFVYIILEIKSVGKRKRDLKFIEAMNLKVRYETRIEAKRLLLYSFFGFVLFFLYSIFTFYPQIFKVSPVMRYGTLVMALLSPVFIFLAFMTKYQVTDRGILIKPLKSFPIFLKPLFIPWDDIEYITRGRMIYSSSFGFTPIIKEIKKHFIAIKTDKLEKYGGPFGGTFKPEKENWMPLEIGKEEFWRAAKKEFYRWKRREEEWGFKSSEASATRQADTSEDKKSGKSPGVTAALNFILPGSGYLYLGKWWGIPVIFLDISLTLGFIAGFLSPEAYVGAMLSVFILGVFFAIHGYYLAKKMGIPENN